VSSSGRLKKEVGEIPTRSRHCKWEQAASNATVLKKVWEGAASNDHKPGDLPISLHQISYEDRSSVADLLLSLLFH